MTSDAGVSPGAVQSVRKDLSRKLFPAGATIFCPPGAEGSLIVCQSLPVGLKPASETPTTRSLTTGQTLMSSFTKIHATGSVSPGERRRARGTGWYLYGAFP